MKILLAEDNCALAGRLFHLLVKNGCQTTAVKTGQAAAPAEPTEVAAAIRAFHLPPLITQNAQARQSIRAAALVMCAPGMVQ